MKHRVTLTPRLGIVLEIVRENDLQRLLDYEPTFLLTQDVLSLPPAPSDSKEEGEGVEESERKVLFSNGEVVRKVRDARGMSLVLGGGGTAEVPSEWLVPKEPSTDDDIPWNLRVRILIDVARGLNSMHSHNPPILHRDLRSPNVFLASRDAFDKGVVAKVADFGMAGVNHYQMGKFLKTWQWLAPEVLGVNVRGYDERSDIYSFGIVMYEMGVRRFPYLDDYQVFYFVIILLMIIFYDYCIVHQLNFIFS